MNNYFKKNGFLTEEGENLLLHFKGAIDILFDTDECQDLTVSELRILQSNMLSMVNDRFSRRFAHKQQVTNKLNEMTDEKFEEYLSERYGAVWDLLGVEQFSEEEIQRVTPQLKAKIEKAMKGKST